MKIICGKDNLMEGINIVQKAVSTKTTLPILEGILLDAAEQFKMTGNDLEIGIECFVEADIQTPGSVVINSKMFGDIVRRLPESEILIEVKHNHLVSIECENSHFELKGISPDAFPAIPTIQKENTFKIPQKMVKEMIRQTLFAVGMDENRPILMGSLISCKDNEIIFVSIDGYRLALRKNQLNGNGTEFNVVVPGKTLSEIGKILQILDDEIEIYNSKNQIMFDLGKCKIVSRLLEGDYLNYKGILPQEHETKVRVNTKELLSSIERASLITMEEKKYPVKFTIKDDKIIINSNTDIGTVREEVNVKMEGSSMEIGFNPRYFMDALRIIEDETIDIYFTSHIGPCTIKPTKEDNYRYMILPVRTRND